ncbi:MAG: cobalt-precorrin-5B (C(1))-methyltransferase CbiD [Clostridium sp.]|nr:cobalt-precorrin-5B (C(1))-methyltransferase CbiD [Clostridium sp.]
MERYIMKNQKRLRSGITTGTCAAAAARAAAMKLLGLPVRKTEDSVAVCMPKGITVNVPVAFVSATDNFCEYMVVKDSGDDPDVTDGVKVYARVERLSGMVSGTAFHSGDYSGLYLEGGSGIGRITQEGMEQAVGQAAINIVPREMIFQAVGEVCRQEEYHGALLITVSIPEGKELAGKTFNPRMGIEGGLSVLGTSGILEPMSERAIVGTIEAEIKLLAAQGKRQLLAAPGNYGQSYIKDYLHLDIEKSVKCSNYIGETIDLAIAYGMERFLLVGNIGKLVKLAAGIMNTHSRVADARAEIFAVHAILGGGTTEMAEVLMKCVSTEQMLEHLEEWKLREPVLKSICGKIEQHMGYRIGEKMEFGVVLFSERFGYLGQTDGAGRLCEYMAEK